MPLQKWSDDIWICRLADRPGLTEDLDELNDSYCALTPPPHLVLDLSQLTTVGSMNLSQMLALHQHAEKHQRHIKLASPSSAVWSVFLATALDNVFGFSADPATALTELQLG
ncbi:MAG: STAS domain-containing protein [Algisphaera sp.]